MSCRLPRLLPATAFLAGVLTSVSLAAAEPASGWQVERGVDPPGYAAIDLPRNELGIESIVLGCEEFAGQRGLQLQLYLSDGGPLVHPGEPRAEIGIDGQRFPVGLYFSEDYVVLADDAKARMPVLSKGLLDALQTGRLMMFRLAVRGEAVVDLQSGIGSGAVGAVRRCIDPRLRVADAKH